MECHGDRFRAGGHSTVSLEPLKETLFTHPRCSWQTTREEFMTKSSKISGMVTIGEKGDDGRCGVDGPTLTTS